MTSAILAGLPGHAQPFRRLASPWARSHPGFHSTPPSGSVYGVSPSAPRRLPSGILLRPDLDLGAGVGQRGLQPIGVRGLDEEAAGVELILDLLQALPGHVPNDA